MINYAIYQSHRKGNTNGKYYARAVHSEIVDLEGLADHMCSHNCAYSRGQIRGLLDDMIGCIRELTLAGNKVKLPNLGIFKAGINTTGTENVKDFNVNENVVRVAIKCLPTGSMSLSRSGNWSKVKLKQVDVYDKSQLEPEQPGEGG